MSPRPKFITFDCYGTLTHFDMAGAARRIYGDALSEPAQFPAEGLDLFTLAGDQPVQRIEQILEIRQPDLDLVEPGREAGAGAAGRCSRCGGRGSGG